MADGETSSSSLLDYQTKELQRYRDALRKLGQDVLNLRQQVRALEADNARLRREHTVTDRGSTDPSAYRIIDNLGLEDLTKAELIARYANLKARFDHLADELRDYKDRTQKLQNELLLKPDADYRPLLRSAAGLSNIELRRQLDDEVERSKSLEATRARQAMAIADLEKEVANLRLVRYDDTTKLTEDNLALRLENSRLKDELEMRPSRDLPREIAWAERYDAAQARIRQLEQQLIDEAHQWNVERAGLLAELRDAKSRWVPVYSVPTTPPPPPLRPLIVRKQSGYKPPWRPHHGNLTERQRKETRLYKS